MNHLLISILVGLGIGYLAQRSRMCFVGGIRDYILVRDKVLLRGFAAFFLTAWVLYSMLFFLGVIHPQRSLFGTEGRAAVTAPAESHASAQPTPIGKDAATATGLLSRILPLVPKLSFPALQFFLSGFGLGFLSVLANGCPLRQHILAAQGNLDSLAYLFGFYGAVLFYDFVLSRLAFLIFHVA
jgi:uncharacterized membrane protein YedE/YeeE